MGAIPLLTVGPFPTCYRDSNNFYYCGFAVSSSHFKISLSPKQTCYVAPDRRLTTQRKLTLSEVLKVNGGSTFLSRNQTEGYPKPGTFKGTSCLDKSRHREIHRALSMDSRHLESEPKTTIPRRQILSQTSSPLESPKSLTTSSTLHSQRFCD
jgi:hypothetical protein